MGRVQKADHGVVLVTGQFGALDELHLAFALALVKHHVLKTRRFAVGFARRVGGHIDPDQPVLFAQGVFAHLDLAQVKGCPSTSDGICAQPPSVRKRQP